MSRGKTASFTVEIPLSANAGAAKRMRSRFEAGRNLYNAVLGEAVKRLKSMRRSPEWKAACAIPKGLQNKDQRKEAFASAREKYGFSEYAFHRFATTIRNSWIAEHLDAHTAQTLATRAFKAVEKVALGLAKKVRFRSKGRSLDSLEGKTNKQGIRFVLDKPEEGNSGKLVWGKLEIPALIDWQDPVIRHGLSCRIKYVRVIRRKASSSKAEGADCTGQRYYVQLIVEGKPYQKPKNKPGKAVIGLDIGPSTIAIGSQDAEIARLEQFCPEIRVDAAAKRRLQRKLDRQRRANNPDHFDEKGQIKKSGKGKRLVWKNSAGYQATRRRLANADRKLAAHRKSLHGRLANEIIRAGNVIKTEKVSYKGWQRLFGKSVGTRAPGMFVEMLKRTVARTGGTFLEFSTRTTKLSQVCHGCGTLAKKPLSQRTHKCECGIGPVQRDLYSGWLASYVEVKVEVDPITKTETQVEFLSVSATLKWEGVESRLSAVTDSLIQRANEGEVFPRSMGIPRARARLPQSLSPTTAKNFASSSKEQR
jgi:transposase